jgi:hypothetical protein
MRRLFVVAGFLGDGGNGSRVIFSEALREAILKSSQPPRSQAAPYRPRKAALNWVDYLVIAATVLTFGIVIAVNNPHSARAQSRPNLIPASELPVQTGQLKIDPDLLRAKIGLATLRPWG